MPITPHEAVHAAHRCPHQQPQPLHAQPFDQQTPLRLNHVGIVVIRKAHPEPVARLRRLAMTDAVGQDHVVAAEVERLPGPIQLLRELRLEELLPAAAGPVKHHHRIDDPSHLVASRGAERRVMHFQRSDFLAVGKGEIAQDRIALCELGGVIDLRHGGSGPCGGEYDEEFLHDRFPYLRLTARSKTASNIAASSFRVFWL